VGQQCLAPGKFLIYSAGPGRGHFTNWSASTSEETPLQRFLILHEHLNHRPSADVQILRKVVHFFKRFYREIDAQKLNHMALVRNESVDFIPFLAIPAIASTLIGFLFLSFFFVD
jgi:hypothetical protein